MFHAGDMGQGESEHGECGIVRKSGFLGELRQLTTTNAPEIEEMLST